MNKTERIVAVVLVGLMVIGTVWFTMTRGDKKLGSVVQGNEYRSTTTPVSLVAEYVNPVSGPSTLGSVVWTLTTGGAASKVTLYDATSTDTALVYGTTTIASFAAAPTAGTYTFDIALYRGLLIEYTSGLRSSSTITFRP